jgi:hypothetical protein
MAASICIAINWDAPCTCCVGSCHTPKSVCDRHMIESIKLLLWPC